MKILIAAWFFALSIHDFFNFLKAKDRYALDYIMAFFDPVLFIAAVILLISGISQLQIPL